MRKDLLLAAGTAIFVWVPVSASAGMCDGALSWLCFNSDPEAPRSATSPQATVTGENVVGSPAADVSTNCLTRQQVQGGYPRYRVMNGRRCWFASVEGPPKHHARAEKRADIDVNPHGDSIWQETDAAKEAVDCEIQALKLHEDEKLNGDEKSNFLRECKAGNLQRMVRSPAGSKSKRE